MSITWRTATALSAFTDSATPFAEQSWTLPTGHAADDLLIAAAGWKPVATGVSASAGWDAAGDQSTSSGQTYTPGVADEGDVRVAAWTRVHDGDETAPTATPSGEYSPLMLAMLAGDSSVSGSGWSVASTSGTDNDPSGTGVSVVGGSLAWATGDHVVVIVAANSNATPSEGSAALSIANATIGTLTAQIATPTTGTGDDGALNIFTAEVTSGGTGAPTYTSTSGSTNDSHRPVIFLRVREPSGSTNATVTATTVAATSAVVTFPATRNAEVVIGGESRQGNW